MHDETYRTRIKTRNKGRMIDSIFLKDRGGKLMLKGLNGELAPVTEPSLHFKTLGLENPVKRTSFG